MSVKPLPISEVEPPAKIHEGHALDRELTTVAGGPKGWRNYDEHPLTKALADEKIEPDEYAAGEIYRAFFEKIGRSGRDSTDLTTGGGSRTPFTESQVDAIRAIDKIEAALKVTTPRAVNIIRHFCGEGWKASDVVWAAGIQDRNKTWEVIRLCLSKLATAIEKARVKL